MYESIYSHIPSSNFIMMIRNKGFITISNKGFILRVYLKNKPTLVHSQAAVKLH